MNWSLPKNSRPRSNAVSKTFAKAACGPAGIKASMRRDDSLSRRDFFARTAMVGGGLIAGRSLSTDSLKPTLPPRLDKALIAITLDLEMVRNFPRWEDTHWDYEKGDL